MFRVLAAVILAVLTVGFPAASAQSPAGRPNVVLIVADYMGYGDIGPHGVTDIRTPNIDRLAREGVRLINAYGPAPICSPARVGLLTGRYPQRAGFEDNVGPEPLPAGLPVGETTIARMLRDAGYRTGLIGKWHLGLEPRFSPRRHGFDEFFGFLDWSIDYYSHRRITGQPGLYENDTPVDIEGYSTDLFADRAVAFIESDDDRSFFLMTSFNAALPPHQPPGSASIVRTAENWFEGTRADYVGVVEAMDAGVGRILDAIDERDLTQSTLVIFLYDHGGRELGRTEPFFHGFRTLWEGGIRVPLIVRWPDALPAGDVSNQLAIHMDVAATILAAAGVRAPVDRPLDGIDLLPMLTGEAPVRERTLFWRTAYSAYRQKAARRGRFKFLLDDTTEMLFDLENDPGERRNLAYQRPALLQELQAMLAEWEAGIGAVTPPR